MHTTDTVLHPKDLHDICALPQLDPYVSLDAANDTIRFHDVLSGDPLQEDRIPASIWEDPEIHAGFQYLQYRTQQGRLTAHLVLGGHGSADDLASITTHHQELLTDAASPYIGMEMDWRHSDNTPLYPRAITPRLTDSKENPGRYEFQQAQRQWLSEQGKIGLPCELAQDDTSPAASGLRTLWNDIIKKSLPEATAGLSPAAQRAAQFVAERTYLAHRQPALWGRLGFLLAEVHAAEPVHTHLHVPFIIGSWHAGSLKRLQQLDISAVAHHTPHELYDTPAWRSRGEAAMRSMALGRAHITDIQAVI